MLNCHKMCLFKQRHKTRRFCYTNMVIWFLLTNIVNFNYFFEERGEKIIYGIFFEQTLPCLLSSVLLLFPPIYSVLFATSCVLEWKLPGVPSYLLLKTRKNDLIPSCVGFCILCTSSRLLTVEFARHGWGFFFLGKGILGKKGRRKKEECSLLPDMNDSI